MTSIVLKPWGSYEILSKGNKYRIKKLTIKPGGILSLQSHNYRSEHWVVIEGKAEITLGKKIINLQSNDSIFIPKEVKHRISNKDQSNLIIIEVWHGNTLEEEDIVRYQDIYNRI